MVGIVAVIIPDVVLVNVPRVVGELKLPAAFDNCAVKTFPLVYVPVAVKGILKLVFLHQEAGVVPATTILSCTVKSLIPTTDHLLFTSFARMDSL